jgi:pilus assembly protein CpaE
MNASLDFLKDVVGSAESADIVFYVADEATRTAVMGAMPTADIHEGGIQIAITMMSQQESPDVLVVDLSGSEAPESALRTLRTLCQSSTKIIGIGEVNDMHLFHNLVDAGATDYLVKPITSEELTSVIEHAALAAQYEASTQNKCQTVFVTGVRGGVGASSLVTGMAWHIAEKMGINVAVVDLDLIFGTVALEFDLEPSHGLREILENPQRVDSLFIESAVVHATEHLSILAAEELLEDPPKFHQGAMGLLVAELSKQSQIILVDAPCSVLVAHPDILAQGGSLAIVSELKLAAIRDIMRLTSFVKDLDYKINMSVVANKLSSRERPEVSQKEFSRGIGMPVNFVLPWDPKAVTDSAKAGRAVTDAAPKSSLSRAIISTATTLSRHEGKITEKKSLLSKLKLAK